MERLPIDERLGDIVAALTDHQSLILTAAPGAGKSTRVPPALTRFGRVILLQPRRVAARSIARRIAVEQQWTLGGRVGWQVRMESRFSADTELLVATEGILTARLQSDPLLSDFNVIVLDEFHERSIHSDLALAFARQAMLARDDLRLVVMSATLEIEPLQRFLAGAATISVEGRAFPVETSHSEQPLGSVVRDLVRHQQGHVLCFFPGVREIEEARRELAGIGANVLPLHGSLSSDEQDAALAPSASRKVILATNIAETSLTVEGVTAVVDSGYHRVMRYDAARAVDTLVTERITRDSAEQRRGRAGRTAPGVAVRLWNPRVHLEPHREAEIHRVDLAAPALEVYAWGSDPLKFDWFERPDAWRLDAARELLSLLGLVRDGRLTPFGRRAQRLPLHPRLATLLLRAGGSRRAAIACALISEGRLGRRISSETTSSSDLLLAVDECRDAAVERQAKQLMSSVNGREIDDSDEAFLRATLAAYPDRVGRRREAGSDRVVLATGSGAVMARESSVRRSEYLVAVELRQIESSATPQPLITMASSVEAEWLEPTATTVETEINESGGVKAIERLWYGKLLLREKQVEPSRAEVERLQRKQRAERGLSDPQLQRLVRRAAFADVAIDIEQLVETAASMSGRVDWMSLLPYDLRRELDREAPESIAVPSGRNVRVEYDEHGNAVASVKLQELFGLTASPRFAHGQKPLIFVMLSPNGSPVQKTADLASFWARTYAEVRKDLRGRYPKHPWPEDPYTAVATARTKKRM